MSELSATATPFIASYILLKRGPTVAFVLRKNTGWMDDYYGLVSGKVEQNEDYETAAIREAKEEAGVVIAPKDLKFVHIQHRRQESDWVDVYFEADAWKGEPFNAEPDKHSELVWLDINNLPNNVIPAVVTALQAITKGQHYSTFGW